MFYKDKDVIIVGGSNSAVTEAIYLSKICKTVTIVYRKDKLKAEQILIDRIEKIQNIKVLYNKNIVKYNLEDDKLVSVQLDNKQVLLCDGVFLAIGFIPNSELFELEKENGYIKVDDTYETSIQDVYACGDIIKKSIYQLTTATSDATIAATNIIKKFN